MSKTEQGKRSKARKHNADEWLAIGDIGLGGAVLMPTRITGQAPVHEQPRAGANQPWQLKHA